jgi:plasmid maintenance system killer protein
MSSSASFKALLVLPSASSRRSTRRADWTILLVPPSNRLEKLKGDLKDFHSIRVNDQWRVIFKWIDGEPHDVRIVDYH